MEERLIAIKRKIDTALEHADPVQSVLLLELFREVELLSEENVRLRKGLVKASQQSGSMSSKLKDALYE
ncbi:MAG: hypothetical protein K0Q73_6550 [Paenibacillus sp.]|nr:hypothetical protein [Paenibacillus sp.]